jgi:hypothetical protein
LIVTLQKVPQRDVSLPDVAASISHPAREFMRKLASTFLESMITTLTPSLDARVYLRIIGGNNLVQCLMEIGRRVVRSYL